MNQPSNPEEQQVSAPTPPSPSPTPPPQEATPGATPPPPDSPTSKLKKLAKNNPALIVVVGLVIAALVAAFMTDNLSLGGKKGPVVATVNGEKIYQSELTERIEAAKASAPEGTNIDEQALQTEMINGLINEALILQRAEEEGLTPNEEFVNRQFENFKNSYENEEAFQNYLRESNSSEEQLRDALARQSLVQEYLEKHIPRDSISVTQQEVQDAYNRLDERTEEELPPLSEVDRQVAQQLISQRYQQKAFEHVEELKKNSEIEILL